MRTLEKKEFCLVQGGSGCPVKYVFAISFVALSFLSTQEIKHRELYMYSAGAVAVFTLLWLAKNSLCPKLFDSRNKQ